MKNLKLISLRVGDMYTDTSSIRKSLKSNTDYFFYQGYKIDSNDIVQKITDKGNTPAPSIYIQPNKKLDSNEFPLSYDQIKEQDLNINICAIVGENGCGKSALIEIMMRIINNFACYILGEYRSSWAAENLLYVEGVRALLFYLGTIKVNENGKTVDKDYCYKLEVCDRKVILHRDGIELYSYGKWDIDKPIDSDPNKINILNEFFYTIVSNYSVYAYNTNDFWSENSDKQIIARINNTTRENYFNNQFKRIEQIRKELSDLESKENVDNDVKKLAQQFLELKIKQLEPKLEEERSWLMGLFHKNDGYTAPMVITPFRSHGNMDINNESFLAKSRLLSLIASGIVKNINGKPINRIELEWYKDKCFDSFTNVFEEVGLGDIDCTLIDKYSKKILDIYVKLGLIHNKKLLKSKEEGVEYALRYLVYKTLKISRNYARYNLLYNTLSFNSANENDVYSAIDYTVLYIKSDTSHITLKVNQILSYLWQKQYKCANYYIKYEEDYPSNTLFFDDCLEFFKRNEREIPMALPPPIFDTKIVLKDKSNGEDIPFHTLSSGERQFSYFTSSVVYHLRNLESTGETLDTLDNGDRVAYGSACLIFEEIELYFHPEMQRRLICNLIDMIKSARLKHLRSIQMIFITHSPFILSDIPRKNCMFLKDGVVMNTEPYGGEMKTYGANIYDMLKSSFFLEDGAIGEYAKKRINMLIDKINYVHFSEERNRIIKRNEELKRSDATSIPDAYLKELKYLENEYQRNGRFDINAIKSDLAETAQSDIDIIDEPIVKTKLTEMLNALNIKS